MDRYALYGRDTRRLTVIISLPSNAEYMEQNEKNEKFTLHFFGTGIGYSVLSDMGQAPGLTSLVIKIE
jgi:hypothetical protein